MSLCLDGFDPHKTIVHVHGWTKSLSSSVVQEALQRDFQIVISLHDYFVACPNGGFYNYKKKHICRLKPLSKACVLSNCDNVECKFPNTNIKTGLPNTVFNCPVCGMKLQ